MPAATSSGRAWTGSGGPIVHPRTPPEDLDNRGQGSHRDRIRDDGDAGAGDRRRRRAHHRDPGLATYFWTGANSNELADTLRADIDEAWIHEIVLSQILHDQQG